MQKSSKTKKADIIDTIRAETISELTEKLGRLGGAIRLGFETRLDICEGLSVIYAGYRKEIHEFCDAFGFMPDYDVTVYKHAVYLFDENEDKKFLGIFPRDDYKGNKSESVVNTVADLLEKLKTLCGDKDDIQLLSPDSNFELKGFITQGYALSIKKIRNQQRNLLFLRVIYHNGEIFKSIPAMR